MVMSFQYYNDVMDRSAAVLFLSFPRVGMGYVRYNIFIWVKQRKSRPGVQEFALLYLVKNHDSGIGVFE